MSDAAAGRFAAAQLLCGGVLLLTGAVATAFFPVIASRATHRRQLVVSGLAATTGLVALGVVALVVAGPAVIRALYGAGFDSDRLVLTNLGLSVAVVGIATYAMWAVRAVHVDSLAVVGAVGLAVMLELGFGMAAHHTMTVLALAPAVCILAASGVAGAALWLRGWARRRRLSSSSAASPIPLRGTAGLDFGE
jgi:O-antigen/teichoic acid export membrane protein